MKRKATLLVFLSVLVLALMACQVTGLTPLQLTASPTAAPQTTLAPSPGGQTDLGSQHTIFTNLSAMTYLNEVVQLGTATNDGIANCSSIDSGVSSHLHVILDYNPAGLGYLIKTSVLGWREAKSVAADNHSILKYHSVSDLA